MPEPSNPFLELNRAVGAGAYTPAAEPPASNRDEANPFLAQISPDHARAYFASDLLKQADRDKWTWDRLKSGLEEFGIDPEPYREGYKKTDLVNVAKSKLVGQNASTLTNFKRSAMAFGDVVDLPFGGHVVGGAEYTEAKKRFEGGGGTAEDADTMALYERQQDQDRAMDKRHDFGLPTGKMVQMAAGLAKISQEGLAAGPVLRGAAALGGRGLRGIGVLKRPVSIAPGLPAAPVYQSALRRGAEFTGVQAAMLPLMPSQYVPLAQQINIREGRDASDVRGYPSAMAYGLMQNLVLGRIVKGNKPGEGWIGLKKGAGGVAEMAVADVTMGALEKIVPKEYRTGLNFGAFGKVSRGAIDGSGELGDGLEDMLVQALSFGALAKIHKRVQGDIKDPVAEALQGYAEAKVTRKDATAKLNEGHGRITKAWETDPFLTRDQAKELFKDEADPVLKKYGETLADGLIETKPPEAATVPVAEPEPREVPTEPKTPVAEPPVTETPPVAPEATAPSAAKRPVAPLGQGQPGTVNSGVQPPGVVSVRDAINRHNGDSNKAFDEIRANIFAHMQAGGKVSLWMDGKQIPVAKVENGKIYDSKGQPWGLFAIAMSSTSAKGGVEFHAAPSTLRPAAPLGQGQPGKVAAPEVSPPRSANPYLHLDDGIGRHDLGSLLAAAEGRVTPKKTSPAAPLGQTQPGKAAEAKPAEAATPEPWRPQWANEPWFLSRLEVSQKEFNALSEYEFNNLFLPQNRALLRAWENTLGVRLDKNNPPKFATPAEQVPPPEAESPLPATPPEVAKKQARWDAMTLAERRKLVEGNPEDLKEMTPSERGEFKKARADWYEQLKREIDVNTRPQPEERILPAEIESLLERAKLPEAQNDVVADILSDLSFEQSAARRGIGKSTVTDRLKKALVRLKEVAPERFADVDTVAEFREQLLRDREAQGGHSRGRRGAGQAAKRREQVEEDDSYDALHAGLPMPRLFSTRRVDRPDLVAGSNDPTPIAVDRAAVEAAMTKAHGAFKADTWLARRKEELSYIGRALTRSQIYLSPKEFAKAIEGFRMLKENPLAASGRVNLDLAKVVDKLGPHQLTLLERKLVTDNLLWALDHNQPLRFGFKDRAEVQQYQDKLNKLIAATPEVQTAIAERTRVMHELQAEAVAAGVLNPANLKNDAYYHQMVNFFADNPSSTRGGSRPLRMKRDFERARTEGVDELPSDLDYNTSFLEAEAKWQTELRIEIGKEAIFKKYIEPYDRYSQIEASAKAAKVDWKEMMRQTLPDHDIWSPEPGNLFYKAHTIPEKLAQEILLNSINTQSIDPKALKEALVMGGLRRPMVLPKDLVKQLNDTLKPKNDSVVSRLFGGLQSTWRASQLFTPHRFAGYWLRNRVSDMEAILAAAPRAVKYLGQAQRDLQKYLSGDPVDAVDLVRETELGVLRSGMTAREISDASTYPAFERFADKIGNERGVLGKVGQAALSVPRGWFRFAHRFNDWAEATGRLAVYRYYLDKINNGEKFHYGAAKKATVDELIRTAGNDVAAAHLTRKLLGDYGDLTHFGEHARKHLAPFYSFIEINFKRWPRLLENSVRDVAQGNLGSAASGLAATGLRVATASALVFPRLVGLYAAVWAWNNLVMGDEEKDLTPEQRASLHITLGRYPGGRVATFNRLGSLNDLADWFGINQAIALMPQLAADQISTGKYLGEVALAGPVNHMVQASRPEPKALFELGFGMSSYPDITKPRPARRDEIAAGVIGLRDELKLVKGQLGSGDSVQPYYGAKFRGVASWDPGQAAVSEIHDLRKRFLEKKGKEDSGTVYGPSAIAKMRTAVANGDPVAFADAKKNYLASGHTLEQFKESVKAMDPITGRLNQKDAAEFEFRFLTAQQKEKLAKAREHTRRQQAKLTQWWGGNYSDKPERRTMSSILPLGMGMARP